MATPLSSKNASFPEPGFQEDSCGDYDGVISVYDIRIPGNHTVFDSRDSENKHIDTV